jgi:hypothetical protein
LQYYSVIIAPAESTNIVESTMGDDLVLGSNDLACGIAVFHHMILSIGCRI